MCQINTLYLIFPNQNYFQRHPYSSKFQTKNLRVILDSLCSSNPCPKYQQVSKDTPEPNTSWTKPLLTFTAATTKLPSPAIVSLRWHSQFWAFHDLQWGSDIWHTKLLTRAVQVLPELHLPLFRIPLVLWSPSLGALAIPLTRLDGLLSTRCFSPGPLRGWLSKWNSYSLFVWFPQQNVHKDKDLPVLIKAISLAPSLLSNTL